MEQETLKRNGKGPGRGAVFLNLIIILIIAALGIWIAYICTAIFTHHGQKDIVPGVENMSYAKAVEKLHDHGFKVEIRDSLYRDDLKPGIVIEQFPKAKSIVKPGRKIFLYINAFHPKMVVIEEGRDRGEAMRGQSMRQCIARLQELGFKSVQIVKVLGNSDRVVKILANGRTVMRGQRVPINSKIIVEVYDGRLESIRDSLVNAERAASGSSFFQSLEYDEATGTYIESHEPSYVPSTVRPSSSSSSSNSYSEPSTPVEEEKQEETPEFVE